MHVSGQNLLQMKNYFISSTITVLPQNRSPLLPVSVLLLIMKFFLFLHNSHFDVIVKFLVVIHLLFEPSCRGKTFPYWVICCDFSVLFLSFILKIYLVYFRPAGSCRYLAFRHLVLNFLQMIWDAKTLYSCFFHFS